MLYIQIVQFFLYLKYDLVDLKEESMGDAMPRNRNLSAHANHPARDILQKHTLTPE